MIESRVAIHRARRKAALQDVLQLVLLGGLDFLAFRFRDVHVPSLDRHDSLMLLAVLNAAIIGWLWLARVMPSWNARRIANTWSRVEQTRFSETVRRW
ncbi:MAG: hypothetical protein JOZ54_09345 [Acidobacteria bacterium]|nr:hypothetical protein [Acidobacteriota bacterium]